MKITLLGTGSPVPSIKRASSSYLVEINDDVIVIDHGPGSFMRLMQTGKRALDVSHVFLTHLHFDHCFDFLRLYHHRWDASGDDTRPLTVHGPAGTQMLVDRVFGPNGAFAPDLVSRTSHPQSLGAYRERGGTLPRPWPDTSVNEMTGPGVVEGNGWRIIRREVPHFQPYLDSFGYRVEADGKVFAYTSDLNLALPGGAPAALRELVEGADVLVHYLNAFAFEARKAKGFAGPKFAAELARDASVKTLVTSHHGPWIDSDGMRERMIADIGAIFSGRIVWGEDLMSFQV